MGGYIFGIGYNDKFKYFDTCPNCGAAAGPNGLHEEKAQKTGKDVAKTVGFSALGILVGQSIAGTVQNTAKKYIVCSRCGLRVEANGWVRVGNEWHREKY